MMRLSAKLGKAQATVAEGQGIEFPEDAFLEGAVVIAENKETPLLVRELAQMTRKPEEVEIGLGGGGDAAFEE